MIVLVGSARAPGDGARAATASMNAVDALSLILKSVRLRSTVLSLAELQRPFAVSTSGAPGRAIFHALTCGTAELAVGDATHALAEGDVVIVTHGEPHTLRDREGTPVSPLRWLRVVEGPIPIARHGGPGPRTDVLCGAFALDHAAAESFLALLPPLLHLRAADAPPARAEWMRATVALVIAELSGGEEGGAARATRLCDAILAQALSATRIDASRGWLAALHDPAIGRALAAIHEDPRTRWDATVLAERVGMSRTRFFARFTELVGEPPAAYLSRWRVQVAADLLRREDPSTAQLAEETGYASEEAFCRVFRRHLGVTPAEYRRRLRAG